LYGDEFLTKILQTLWETVQTSDDSSKVKNIMNCFLHLYLFQSISTKVVYSAVRYLLDRFNESDIEVLIFLFHNVGFQLRKAEPESLKGIIEIYT
jgi:hypothetical protein